MPKTKKELDSINDVVVIGETESGAVSRVGPNSTQLHFTNEKACTCPFNKTMSLPCRHIMHFLRTKNMEMFVSTLCNKRWLKSYLPMDLIGNMKNDTVQPNDSQLNNAEPNKHMSQIEKFQKANNTTKTITEMLSEKPINIFQTLMDLLQQCQIFIENDTIFSVEPITSDLFIYIYIPTGSSPNRLKLIIIIIVI